MTQQIVVLGGLGDVYLVASLYESFCQNHHTHDVELIIKGMHSAVVDLFPGTSYKIDDAITFGTEADRGFQNSYENILGNGKPYFAHPCMKRSQACLDWLPTKSFITQADLFRIILRLDAEAPLTVPKVPQAEPIPNTVMIVEATTWPNTQPHFYSKLVTALRGAGRDVWINDKKLPLVDLFRRAAATEWVIGPQCGLMSIFVTGRWPCRKTLASSDIDGGRVPPYWARETFPYAYVRAFAGFDFDVEEYKITDSNHGELISMIVNGANALQLYPHDPAPTCSIMMSLSPGDFLDRLAVLTVKYSRFAGNKRAAMEREYQRHIEARNRARLPFECDDLFQQLVNLHAANFDVLERMVPSALDDGMISLEDHVAAVKSNKARIDLKRKIDGICRAPYSEVKSYHRGE